jgi:hypothetical protein
MPGAWLGLADPTLRGHFFFKKKIDFVNFAYSIFYHVLVFSI